MWTTTTRLHLLNAISRYGLRKTSFIDAYLKVYAKMTTKTWKIEYNKMVKEYIKNKGVTETVQHYFHKKRNEAIDGLIEKKKQEKVRIIERMIYGYDSLENSDEESDDAPWQKTQMKLSPEIAALGDTTMPSIWGVKTANTLTTTLLHLSTLSNLPPHLELPGPKPETTPYVSPADASIHSYPQHDSSDDTPDSQYPQESNKDQELEDILTTLEHSGYGTSISSVDTPSFERFFKWTQDKISQLETRKKEAEAQIHKENEEKQKEKAKEERLAPPAPLSIHALKEYYSLDFHEYPKKRSPKDRGKWILEFPLVLSRVKMICGGTITCEAHKYVVPEKDLSEDAKKGRKKIPCIKCFSAEILEDELEKDYRPAMAEYIFSAMLFLQTVIFTKHLEIPPKEVDLVKSELYKFYEYYRK
ncbi:hypothetical protein NEDG_00865 [Nematocida displodere]|uniref:Uncharacterized protein n=1 Tax=Nematocida displodere TaxID=1805483 RepID=A0A177EF24_9MICR|nr:hypothetical protein NEDG_00865 [Nematocida displodere]